MAFRPRDGVVVDASETLSAVTDNRDPKIVVLSRDEIDNYRFRTDRWLPRGASWSSDTLGHAWIEVRGPNERLVATSLTHPRGWTATVDGAALETITVNHAFLGVIVPESVRHVSLEFVPPGFRAGVAIGIAGLLIMMSLWLWGAFRTG
jgi:hypothetical protein